MDNGRITGGAVSYMRRVNKGNYEHEEASAKIDFVAHDGMDASPVLAAAETEAKASVMAQLGLQSARPLAAQAAPIQGTAPTSAAKEPEVKKVVAHRKSKEIEALDAAGPSADPLAPAANASAPATQLASPAASVASAGGDDPLAPASAASTGAVDDPLAPAGASATTASTPSTDDPFTAQREVTDADLATAAAKKNEALVKVHKEAGTMKIRDLVGQFLPPGKTLRDLAQADRPAFLVKLEALA